MLNCATSVSDQILVIWSYERCGDRSRIAFYTQTVRNNVVNYGQYEHVQQMANRVILSHRIFIGFLTIVTDETTSSYINIKPPPSLSFLFYIL